MAAGRMGWALGILALALWAGVPCAAGQHQSAKRSSHRAQRNAVSRRRNAQGVQRRSVRRSANAAATRQGHSPLLSSGRATATARRVPESGTPTLENPRPTGTLETLPNQTLTPGATTVPSNAGGIAPASNDASSGEFTPSEGKTAPTTPGGNPSETQGVPTFSSAAQTPAANLPRTVSPAPAKQGTPAPARKSRRQPH